MESLAPSSALAKELFEKIKSNNFGLEKLYCKIAEDILLDTVLAETKKQDTVDLVPEQTVDVNKCNDIVSLTPIKSSLQL